MAGLLGSISHVLVRWVHLVAMAVLVGGAMVVWAQLRGFDDGGLAGAATYEWLFWGAAGLAVLAGVGNLGAMAPAVPDPASAWGTTFTVKLVGVGGLLLGSLVRSISIIRWRSMDDPSSGRPERVYAATTVYLIGLVALGEMLAHG